MARTYDNSTSIYKTQNGVYYIHYHVENLRKSIAGTGVGVAATLQQQKRQASRATTNIYKKLLSSNINSNSVDVLSGAMNLTSNDVIQSINDGLQDAIQSAVNHNKLSSLRDLQSSFDSKDLSNILHGGKAGFDSFNKILRAVSQALELLDSSDASALAAVLSNQVTKGGYGTRRMGQRLQKALKDFQIANQGKSISQKSVQNAINNLNGLAAMMATNKGLNGEKLSVKALSTNINNNLFSTSLAEGVSAMLDFSVAAALYDATVELTGTQTENVKIYDVRGFEKGELEAVTVKTDMRLSNVSIDLDAKANRDGGQLSITVGISDKFYKNQGFPGLKESVTGTYSSGSGGSLKEALYALFGASFKKNYWARNVLAHGDEALGNSVHQLNDLILTRQILRLFSTTGGKDFSMFMLVNGKLVSIWDMVQYVIQNDVGLSNSQNKKGDQAITLSIPGRKDIQSENKKYEGKGKNLALAWERSRRVNAVIDSTKIYAKLHTDKLIQATIKMNS